MRPVEAMGGGKLKDRIVTILGIDHPLTAKRIHHRLKNDFQVSVTYQAVHKALQEMVASKVLTANDRQYKISLDWLNSLERFSTKIREQYAPKRVLMQKIKVVSFDMDGCLADNSFDELIWRTKIPEVYAKEHRTSFEEAFEKVTSEYKRLWGKVQGWRDIRFWFDHFRFKTKYEDVVNEAKNSIKPYGDVLPVVKALRKHFRISIISHAARRFLDLKINALGIKEYIDRSFSSTTDFQEYTKSKRVFGLACEELGIKPEQMVHIGDSEEHDYKTPSALGITCFVIDRIGNAKSDHIVRDLFEFRDNLLE